MWPFSLRVQHRELVTNAFSKVVPPSTISSRRLGMYFRSPTAASSVMIRMTFGRSGSSCWGSGGGWPWAVGRQPASTQANRRSRAARPASGRTLLDRSPPEANLPPTRSPWGRESLIIIPCAGSAQAPRAPGSQQAQKLCYTFWRCASPLTQGPYEGGRGRQRGGPGVLFDLIRAVPVALIVGLVPAVALILSSLFGTGVTSTVSVVSVLLVFFAGLAARLVFGPAKGPEGPISPLPPAPGILTLAPLCLALLLALGTFFGLVGAWAMIPAAALVVLSGILYWLSLRREDVTDGGRGEEQEASPAVVYGLLSAALVLALARGYLGPLFNGWPFPRGVDRYEHAIMTSMMVEGGSTESFMLYPPGFHALSAMISNLSGLEPMALFPALGPSLLALTSLASYALAARLWGRVVGVAAAFLSGPVLGGAYLHFAEARYPNFVGEQVILILAVAALIWMYANPTVRTGLLLAVLG